MSAITLQGNASGTGTLSIAAPNTNTNRTLTLPDLTGTLAVNGPAFSAYLGSNQTISTNTVTKLSINTEEYDTASAYDSTTNYRFQPLIAGYYQVNAGVAWASGTGVGYAAIYKNGSSYKQGNSTPIGTISNNSTVAIQVYLNGSTDYVEFYALQNTTLSLAAVNGINLTYFQAAMVRSA